jgi:hypothetical protein
MGGFGPLRSLGESQLQIQFTQSSTYDTQAMGILALNSALLAAAIAAKDLIGHLWWLALIGLLLSSGPCVLALGRTVEQFGPEVEGLLGEAEARSEDEMDQLAAGSISTSLFVNAGLIGAKRRLLNWGLALLGVTLAAAICAVLVL